MIKAIDYGDVRFFRMARTWFGRALYWTGVYAVDGLLIDCGPPNLAREVEGLCRDLRVGQFVATHHHEDHTGNVGLLRERLGIVARAHAAGVTHLAKPDERPRVYRRMCWGMVSPATVEPLSSSIDTDRFRFQVIHTPGHADDHVVLWEPERRWLFSGDLYLAPRLKYLRADEDVHALMDSIRRVAALEPDVLFCQHRGRIENAASMLRTKLDSLTELAERVRDLHRKGLDESAIARALPGSDLVWRVWTGGDFSKLNFVRAFLRSR